MKQDCICRNGLECAACLMKLYAKTATHNVFVYGTLKKGYVNHERTFNGYLHTAMGSTTTLPEWGIAYVSGLPFIVPDKQSVHGEVYNITGKLLARLDRIEGHPDVYKRTMVTLANGIEAYMYVGIGYASHIRRLVDQGLIELDDNFDVKAWRD